MPPAVSPALADYRPAFERAAEVFLHAHTFGDDGSIACRTFTRGDFWSLARRAAGALRLAGCGTGDCIALCVGANQFGDLAIRLAAPMIGVVPVTINWQADTIERIVYKLQSTRARAIVTDRHFDAGVLAAIRAVTPEIAVVPLDCLESAETLSESEFAADVDAEATRIVIFTSGTTGQPKGVRLPYRSYRTNRDTFEQFLDVKPADRLAIVVVNPMHHTNSTAFTDWALRRPGTVVHLVERYSTRYWTILAEATGNGYDRLVAPAVARHFDYLDNLEREGRLAMPVDELRAAMRQVDFLIGSAPVGPTTVQRLIDFTGRVPLVRFGSTETCLQVIGLPRSLPESARLAAFRAGWEHAYRGNSQAGYYIGRPHVPHTLVRIVRAIHPDEPGFMTDCEVGQPGYILTKGDNLMSGYVGNDEATRAVFQDGWYTGLRDIGFTLVNAHDGQLDYYWMSRDSSLLIRGGANYACDQINAELADFVAAHYGLERNAFDLAVVGLKLDSEHEDSCCVTLELDERTDGQLRRQIAETFLDAAAKTVSKGARPDRFRLAPIPRNFKGAILLPELQRAYQEYLAEL